MLQRAGCLFGLNADIDLFAVSPVNDNVHGAKADLLRCCTVADLALYQCTDRPVSCYEGQASKEYRLWKFMMYDLIRQLREPIKAGNRAILFTELLQMPPSARVHRLLRSPGGEYEYCVHVYSTILAAYETRIRLRPEHSRCSRQASRPSTRLHQVLDVEQERRRGPRH